MKIRYLYTALILLFKISINAQVLVKDINTGDLGSSISLLTNINNTLYYTAKDGINGNELWKSDGTTSGTKLIKDINPDGDGLSTTFPTRFAPSSTTFLASTSCSQWMFVLVVLSINSSLLVG